MLCLVLGIMGLLGALAGCATLAAGPLWMNEMQLKMVVYAGGLRVTRPGPT